MMTLLIAAAAMAETSSVSQPAEPVDIIVVEGRRSGSAWELPKLKYDVPESCPAFLETEVPGFGTMRLRGSCASDRTEEWRPFHY